MGISLHSPAAELLNLNVRKEGPEDEQVLAIDLKISCETSNQVTGQLLGNDNPPDLWFENEDKDPRYPAITAIDTEGVFENHELKIGSIKLTDVKIKRPSFTPRPHGMVDLVFTASISNPSQQQVSSLAEMVREDAALAVVAPPDLFNQDAA